MRNPLRSLVVVLAALLAASSALAAADEEEPRVRQRVLRVDKEPQVFFLEGPDGGRGGYLGVLLLELTPELRRHFGAPAEAGVLVSRVEADGPAAKAGVEVGDVLTAVDGDPLRAGWDLVRRVRPREEGESVTLELVRDGKARTVTAVLDERERPMVDVAPLLRRRLTPKDWDIEVDLEAVGPAMERLHRLLEDPAHRDHLRLLREREGELQEKLEQRLKELEKRLQDLEKQLGEPR